ncbi:MAG: ABC-2 family transporter protein [Patescibacteria group bacterium]|nr:ABC-2 family transporter protein [Patescibacteria group bacterium]
MKKEKAIIKTAIEQTLISRSKVIFRLTLSAISLVTTILIWQAVYNANQQISNYTLQEMVTYSFLSFLLNRTSLSIHWRISHDIGTGEINNYLLLPFHYLHFRFLKAFGSRLIADTILSLPVFIGLAWIYKNYLLPPNSLQHLALIFLLVLPLTLFLNLFYTSIIGLSGFWTTEISGLFYLIGSISKFVGGALLPLSAFPTSWQKVLNALPFRYLYAFPIDVYLGKLTMLEIGVGLFVQALWVLSFYIILKIIWHFGIRRHEAYGS